MYNADLVGLLMLLLLLLLVLTLLMLVTAMMMPAQLAGGLSSMGSKTHCSKQAAEAGKGGCQRDKLRLDRDEDWPALGWGGPGAGLLTAHSVTT